jgi:hypothetical protein
VRAEERFYLVMVGVEGKETHPFVPDVSVTTPPGRKKPSKKGTAVAVAELTTKPVEMRACVEEEYREGFIEIYETGPEQRLVTSVEVLSPSNKRAGTQGRELYLRKRYAHMVQGVHLVELDLLRGGQRMPMLDPWPESPYVLMVARARKLQRCQVWPVVYADTLPVLPVPLARPDPDILIDLQPMVDAIYQRSRYARSIDYTKPLDPPFAAEEAAWLEQRLRGRPTP